MFVNVLFDGDILAQGTELLGNFNSFFLILKAEHFEQSSVLAILTSDNPSE